jgi:hypothetical protein
LSDLLGGCKEFQFPSSFFPHPMSRISMMENSPQGFSVNYIQRHVKKTMLKARELAEICGRDVVVDVTEVPMVGDIEDP